MINDRRTVLLIEDDRDDEELTIRGLRRGNLQNPVDVARDGQDALDYLFGSDGQAPKLLPGVVLVDLHLPRVSGLEVLERIRADQRIRRLLVVILTSSREGRDLINVYDLGANSYVCKPIQFDQFAAAVAQLGASRLTIDERAPPAHDDIPVDNGHYRAPSRTLRPATQTTTAKHPDNPFVPVDRGNLAPSQPARIRANSDISGCLGCVTLDPG